MKSELSVVICSHNGAQKVVDLFESLKAQSYPPEKFEVIFVDDGSTDDVSKIAKRYSYKVIKSFSNKGLAESRNMGWKAAKAEIIAFTDDDCIPDSKWVEKILGKFNADKRLIGLSGLVLNKETKTLAQKYIKITRPLSPLSISLSVSVNPVYRLWLYFKRQFESKSKEEDEFFISSVVGANMAFRKAILTEENGFDSIFRFGSEEEELCYRISKNSNNDYMKYFSDIIVNHKFDPGFRSLFRKNYLYGIGNSRLKQKFPERSLTLYPFPWLVLLFFLVLFIVVPSTLLLLFLLPIAFYFQWVIEAIRKRDISLLSFPYIQMGVELSHNAGWVSQRLKGK